MSKVQWAAGVGKRLLEAEVRGIEQDLIQNARQLELVNVPTQGWIIDPDVYGLLDGPCNVVFLPTHNGEVVHLGVMTGSVGMVIDGGRGCDMFLEPFPKGSCRLPYVLLITFQCVIVVPLDYSALLCDVISVLKATRRLLMVLPPLKWTWTPIQPQMFFNLLLKPFV